MVNSLECLEAIDELEACLGAIQSGMKQEAGRIVAKFRYPGPWDPDRLFEAHRLAIEISKEVTSWPRSNLKLNIQKKLFPLLEMYQRK